MAKIKVLLDAFYGYGCCGQGYGSNETFEHEVSEQEAQTLSKIGKKISAKALLKAIDSGEISLQPLYDLIEDRFFKLVEHYWLFEADNECLSESLEDAMQSDIKEGVYELMPFESFVDQLKSRMLDYKDLRFGSIDDIDCANYDWEDEEDLSRKHYIYSLNIYYDWVCEHDNDFIAERVGLDIDACRNPDDVDFTIELLR
ncbi:MAG: hypothetical protein IJX65_02945 [Alistipes sp.]|nr:hypothetical protein [Alistipes sp.]